MKWYGHKLTCCTVFVYCTVKSSKDTFELEDFATSHRTHSLGQECFNGLRRSVLWDQILVRFSNSVSRGVGRTVPARCTLLRILKLYEQFPPVMYANLLIKIRKAGPAPQIPQQQAQTIRQNGRQSRQQGSTVYLVLLISVIRRLMTSQTRYLCKKTSNHTNKIRYLGKMIGQSYQQDKISWH